MSELTSTSSKLNILQFLARLMPKKSQDLSGKYCTAFVNYTRSGILHYIIKEKFTQDRAACPSLHSLALNLFNLFLIPSRFILQSHFLLENSSGAADVFHSPIIT